MLERIQHPNGVVTYQSPLLRAAHIPHAFSTRIGGISPAPFDSLNLGNPADCATPDPYPHIAENYARLQQALGLPNVPRASVKQVHGRSVELLEREPENEYAETLEAELRDRFAGQISADALVTNVPNVLLTIRIADCVPILLASADGKFVAAIHAGWRGIVGNIAQKTVRTLHEAGAPPASLLAAVGPAISLPNFEVGDEVAAEFDRISLSDYVNRTLAPKPHIDLSRAVAAQLRAAGVPAIDTTDRCTFRDAADFFSHRRDHGITGRLAAVIARPSPS